MSKAMNRSIANVLFGAFGGGPAAGSSGAGAAIGERPVRDTAASDVGVLLGYAQRVIVVPGYGMAVAQAQHGVRELADLLEKRGIDVKYAIHPGGRPHARAHERAAGGGQRAVRRAVSRWSRSMPSSRETDVVIVIGANDVVNPAARDDRLAALRDADPRGGAGEP